MTKIELALTELGNFLLSCPHEFIDYEEARKEALENYYIVHDAWLNPQSSNNENTNQ